MFFIFYELLFRKSQIKHQIKALSILREVISLYCGVYNIKLSFQIQLKAPNSVRQLVDPGNNQISEQLFSQHHDGHLMYNLMLLILEFKYILQDIKSQIQQMPHMQSLLKLRQKTTKKLQCLNLYSQVDKRDFDLQIQQQNIYKQINQLYKAIISLNQKPPSQNEQEVIQSRIEEITQKYTRTYDQLTKQQDILNPEFQFIQLLLHQEQTRKEQPFSNQITEMDEYQQQHFDDDPQGHNHGYGTYYQSQCNTQNLLQNSQVKIQKLKLEIQEILKRIAKLNSGKGKWFDTDHRDFVKIYNRCGGNGKKIISQGIKLLGMNQTQIMDHLQLYESYLQLQKEKKLASEEFKNIKFMQQQDEREKQQQNQQIRRLQLKLQKQKQLEERIRKKQLIQSFKLKKAQQKQKWIQNQEQEKQNKFKAPPIHPSKKKDIMERNRMFIQNQQKKLMQAKSKKQSIQNPKRGTSTKKVAHSINKVTQSSNKAILPQKNTKKI